LSSAEHNAAGASIFLLKLAGIPGKPGRWGGPLSLFDLEKTFAIPLLMR
jgi:hypothetical protein